MSNTHTQLSLIAGDEWLIQVNCHQPDGTTSLDLTGATAVWELIDENTGLVVSSASLGSGITVADPTNGIALVSLTSAATLAIASGFYRDRFTVTNGALVSRQAEGPIAVFS
jgi:hypothetical protein